MTAAPNNGRPRLRRPPLRIVQDEPRPYIPEIPPGASTLEAALLYAEAGIYVGPLTVGKHPGSVLGYGWQYKTSRDPEVIRRWFTGTDYGLFLHCGRSGLTVFDVDVPNIVPEVLADAIGAEQPPFQPTRTTVAGRGHQVFRTPRERKFGNGKGKLKGDWGEVRGTNGVIVAYPSAHPNPDQGGCYGPWVRPGAIPVLPDYVADLLPDRTRDAQKRPGKRRSEESDAATDAEVAAFLAEHQGNGRPELLRSVNRRFLSDLKTMSRHDAARDAVAWAMREAACGYYPAQRAAQRLGDAFVEAMAQATASSDRSLGAAEATAELNGILAWAIGVIEDADLDEVRRSVLGRTRSPFSKKHRLRRPGTGQEHDDEAESNVGDPEAEVDDKSEAHGQDEDKSGRTEEPVDGKEKIKDPSWVEVDLGEVIRGLRDGTLEAPRPTIGLRSDGDALFYPKAVNGLHGDSGDGKSFVAQFSSAQEIRLGHHVVYIDLESDKVSICARMLDYGLTAGEIETYFHYWNPDGPYGFAAERRLTELVSRVNPTLVVIDSVGVAVGLEEVDPDKDTEYLAWAVLLPRPVAALGPAVLLIDHSKKARGSLEERLFPSGSQRKRAVITGAAYLVEMVKGRPMAKGRLGGAHLYTAKTKEGHYPRGSVAAIFELDSTGERLQASFEAPEPTQRPEGGGFRPTHKMEQVSRYVEINPGLSKSNVEKAVGGDTKATRLSIGLLIAEGYLHKPDERVGRPQLLSSRIPYREADDPKAGVVSKDQRPFGSGDDTDEDEDE